MQSLIVLASLVFELAGGQGVKMTPLRYKSLVLYVTKTP